jgi:hypothetical protein
MNYHRQKLSYVFLTLQMCVREIIKVLGGNNYTLPHTNKERLECEGVLLIQIECDQSLVQESLSI